MQRVEVKVAPATGAGGLMNGPGPLRPAPLPTYRILKRNGFRIVPMSNSEQFAAFSARVCAGQEERLKLFALSMIALFWLIAATPDASAVVCARGVYRSGCAGPHGAVVVRHRGYYWRRGVRVYR
jgi:hypothetical protein